mmetsp:Transcript_35416/g.56892  ORF Transcript_35416/g.56892 Transcript_35416/m.56892 type:complete len:261 (+) Transcript_35416:149-931(+)
MYIGPWQEYKLSTMLRQIQSHVKEHGIASILKDSKEFSSARTLRSRTISSGSTTTTQSDPYPKVKKIKKKRRSKAAIIHHERVEELRRLYGLSTGPEKPSSSSHTKNSKSSHPTQISSISSSPELSNGGASLVPIQARPRAEIEKISNNSSMNFSSSKQKKQHVESLVSLPNISAKSGGITSTDVKQTTTTTLSKQKSHLPSITLGRETREGTRIKEDNNKQSQNSEPLVDSGGEESDWEKEVDDLVDWSKGLELDDSAC